MSVKKANLERREFLKLGAAGLAAAGALATGCATASSGRKDPATAAAATPNPAPAAAPLRRVLGRTGIEVPVVSLGVMNADNPNLVRAALDRGLRLLDTAHGYQNGRNEEMIGPVLAGRARDSFVLCTKVFLSTADRKTGLFSPDTRPEEVGEKLDLSLKRLGLDHVDVLYLHNQSCREGALFEPALRGLEKAKKDGKARFLGLSTHKGEPEVIRAAIEAKLFDVVLTAYNFRQAYHADVHAAAAEACKAGMGIVAMKTQAGGRFSRGGAPAVNMKAALKWALQDPCITTAIPGFTTFDQLAEDLTVLEDIRLTEAERMDLEGAVKTTGLYCQQCETCLPQCPEGLPIPDLMRGYMYAAGYRNLLQAKDLVQSLSLAEAPCASCAACQVRCVQGFEVRDRIEELLPLRGLHDAFLA